MSIFVTGNIQRIAEYGACRFSSRSWPRGRELTRDDVAIVAGDFGFVWNDSNTDRYWLDWFESKPWTTCFVDGNHENHQLLSELPVREWHGSRAHMVRPHVPHLMRGEAFDIAGTRLLAMGGATSNDIELRRVGVNWWPQEVPGDREMVHCRAVLDRAGWSVDYVVTHEAPAAIAEGLCREHGREFVNNRLQRFLGELDARLQFRSWFFGHYHGDEWRDARHRLVYQDIVALE